jgi:hypothetical protein
LPCTGSGCRELVFAPGWWCDDCLIIAYPDSCATATTSRAATRNPMMFSQPTSDEAAVMAVIVVIAFLGGWIFHLLLTSSTCA